jgi:hypothetical protein
VSALLAGVPAGAQSEEPVLLPLTVDPTSGPAGTVITVGGEQCGGVDDGLDNSAVMALLTPDPEDPLSPPFIVEIGEVAAGEDGSWTGEITVPEGVDPDAPHFVTALCLAAIPGEEEPEVVAEYDFVEFDVTGEEPTTPPPTVEPPVDVPPPPEPETPTAPPAVPVVAPPDFTG